MRPLLVFGLIGCAIAPLQAQQATQSSVDALARRLEETEYRLRQTEAELSQTRVELQNLAAPNASRFASHSRQTGGGGLHGCEDRCTDCGETVCPGVPHYCSCCRETLSWNKAGGWRVVPFGKLELETFFATDSSVNENFIVFAAPRAMQRTERFDATGQSSQIGLNVEGPTLGAFQVGGMLLMDFHGNRPSRNEPGAYFIRGFAELVNEDWRLAFGQMGDTIGAWNGETVNWSGFGGLGYLAANQRGTLRLDRFIRSRENVQWTITGALTQPVVTDLAGFQDAIGQDNGMPNFEGQLLLGLGPDCGDERPLQFSLSGMYGEYFAAASNVPNLPPNTTNTSQAYAVAGAMQWAGEVAGFRGQIWHGRGLGTYMGGISQTLNTATGETIRANGGFGQLWVQVLPRVRLSAFAGVDDPENGDLSNILADNQRVRNQMLGGNVFVNITDYFHVGVDVWNVKTDFVQPGNDNDIVIIMSEATITY